MMTKLAKTLVLGLSGVMAVGAGAAAFAYSAPSAPVSASQLGAKKPGVNKKSHARHHRGLAVTVTAISGQTLTVRHGTKGKPRSVTLTDAALQAGAYKVSASNIAVGEHLHILGLHGTRPVILLQPVARGTLQNSNGSWAVAGKTKTWTLTDASAAAVLGMPSLTAGTTVEVYGVRSAATVTPTAIAAPPDRARAKVTANTAGVVTLVSKKLGTLSYTIPTAGPAKWLSGLKAGRRVIVLANPTTHGVLRLMPAKVGPWRKTAALDQHNVAGQLTSDSASAISLKTAWGTATVAPGSRTITVISPGHPGTALSQIPQGANLLIHITAQDLSVRVLNSTHPAG